MLDIQLKEVNRIKDRALELGKVTNRDEVTITENSDGSIIWITVPNVHGNNKAATFTILHDENKTYCKTYSSILGKR